MRAVLTVILFLLITIQPVSGSFPVPGTFTALDSGVDENYSQFNGKVVLVEAFATWCLPCKSEMNELSQISNQFGDNLTILSLSVSPSTDTLQKVETFKVDAEKTFGFTADWKFGISNGGDDGFSSIMEIDLIPTTMIINADGVVEKRWESVTHAIDISEYLNANVTFPEYDPNNALINQLKNNMIFRIFGLTVLMGVIYVVIIPKPTKEKSME